MSTNQQTMSNSNGARTHENDDAPLKIGVYGWRKRCLYFFVLLLTATVIINLALTIWIIVVMRFNVDGMGKLRIKEDGMVMTDDGKAMFLGPLYASSVRSIDLVETAENDPDDEKGSLSVEADRYLFLQSGGDNGSTVAVTEKDIEARTDSFVVRSGSNEVFRVNSDGVAIASGQLESNGVILFDEIESKSISSEEISAPSGDLTIKSKGDSTLESLTGFVKLQAFDEIKLQSFEDSIILSAPDIYLSPNAQFSGVMEVCMCPSGKLFFASPNATTPCQQPSGIC
ncbi:zeta-sarcoglycan-like [Corticium candelabrum]|uniref:zeta-sarcoglycan-like n=1 Tax=Corticium candelabrum TaxID=121492 RepID=UPI002E255B09|nr:zeta-sarcoglycan-like [Corticium candelabrum]